MPKFDLQAAKRDGLSDEQITALIEQARSDGLDLYIDKSDLNAQEYKSRGPLDPLTPDSPLGASAYWLKEKTPEAIKYPLTEAWKALASRLASGTAAAVRPLVQASALPAAQIAEKYAAQTGKPPAMTVGEVERLVGSGGPPKPMGSQLTSYLGDVAKGFALGKPPEGGLDPITANYDLINRYFNRGEPYSALSPERQDAISRVSLGLPVGEVLGSLIGSGGVAMMSELPAVRAMNLVGGAAYRGVRGATGKIPAIAEKRAIQDMKRTAIRRALAEQAEQEHALKGLADQTQEIAKLKGEPFDVVDERIRTAMMREPMDAGKAMSSLSAEEQAIARAYQQFSAGQVAQDVATGGLRAGERHAHIMAARARAMARAEEFGGARRMLEDLERAEEEFLRAGPKIEPTASTRIAQKRQIGKAKGQVGRVEMRAKKSLMKLEEQLAPTGIAFPRLATGRGIDVEASKPLLKRLPEMLTGHAASVWTKAETVPYVSAAIRPGTMGAKAVATIKGNRSLVTAEKEAEIQLMHGLPADQRLVKTLYESTLLRGNERAVRRANFAMAEDVTAKFGEPIVKGELKPGYRRMSDLVPSKSGYTKTKIAEFENIQIPEKAFRQVQRITETLRSPGMGDFQGALGKVTKAWKTIVLTRTGYPLRNASDGFATAWLGGARGEFAIPAAKATLLARGVKGIDPNEYLPTLKMTLGEYVASARRNGALTGGFISHEVLDPTGKGIPAKGMRAFRAANVFQENYFRALLDMSRRAAGEAVEVAGNTVDDFLGIYHPAFYSFGENILRSTMFPWYSWVKQIVKRTPRLYTERAGSVAQFHARLAQINKQIGFTPAEVEALGSTVKASGAIVRPSKEGGAEPGDVEVFPNTWYGPGDINRMFGLGEKGTKALLTNPVQQMYPVYQWVMAGAGMDPYSGRDFSGADVELPESAKILIAYPSIWAGLGLKIVGNKVFGPDRLNYIMRQSGPQAIAIGDLSASDPDSRRRARAFWTGFSSYVRNLPESEKLKRRIGRKAMEEQRTTKFISKLNIKRSLKRQEQMSR